MADRERESPKGELTSNWRQFVNKVDKDLAVLKAGCYWNGKLTALSEQKKEHVMNKKKSHLTLLKTYHVSDSELLGKNFIQNAGRKEMGSASFAMSDDPEKVLPHPTTEKPIPSKKEREATKLGSDKNVRRFAPAENKGKVTKLTEEERSPDVPPQAQALRLPQVFGLAQMLGFATKARLQPVELKIDWKHALGASRVIPLATGRTSIDLLALRDEILSHRSSEAQHESRQATLTPHEISLPEETWTMLHEMSNQLEKASIRTTPEQLAAFFIRKGILRYQHSEH